MSNRVNKREFMFKEFQLKAILYGLLITLLLCIILGVIGALTYHHFHPESLSRPPESFLVFLICLVLGLLSSVVGGFVTARVAKEFPRFNVLVLGILEIVGGTFFSQPDVNIPAWYDLVGSLAVVPCTYLGGVIALKLSESQARLFKKLFICAIVLSIVAIPILFIVESLPLYVATTKEKAAQGDATDQAKLGRLYQQGLLIPQSYEDAAFWYRKAADQGNAFGEYALGVLYLKGQGVQQDYTEAAKWFGKSAERGNGQAQFELGDCYAKGQGVVQNNEEAAKWWRKSADQGNMAGQSSLGYLYAEGRGVPQNDEEAYFWLTLSSASRAMGYGAALDYLATKLSPEQKAAIQRRVRDWKVMSSLFEKTQER